MSKKKFWHNLLNFGCHLFENSLLVNICSDPIVFSTLPKHHGSHCLNAVEYRLRFFLDVTVSKRHPFSFIFNFGNKAKSQGAKSSE
jgi:hypothetical protein